MMRARTRLVRRSLVCMLVVITFSSGAARAAWSGARDVPSSPATSAVRDRLLGATPADERVEFDFVLRYRQAALDDFVERVNDPSSPGYHRYASSEEIGRRFGISDNGMTRVHAWLETHSLAIVESFPQRTTIRVAGRAANVNAMLGVTLVDRVDRASGRRYHAPRGAPRIDAAFADVIEGVAGLDTRPRVRPVSALAPRETTSDCLASQSCLTPNKLNRAFEISALHERGILGQGQYVAVIMDGPIRDDDLLQFHETGGLTDVPPIERITVGSGPSTKESSDPIARIEGTMDVQTVQAIAPRATVLYFYSALSGFADAVNAVVRDGRAKIITYSAGGCDDGKYSRVADNRALQTANGAGVNVFISSGDHGAFNCLPFNPNDFRVVASEPSDSPFAISVGGTFLERAADGTYIDEAAWVEPFSNWATGGGLAYSSRRPSWQRGPGVDNRYSNGNRQEPDVSAPGDPESGWLIVVNGEEERSGGTSASSPFWAGLTSLFQQMAQQNGVSKLGFLNPTLYALAATNPPNTLFHDIVRGDNLVHETTPGWDFATGLGSPIAPKLGDAIVAYLRAQRPGA